MRTLIILAHVPTDAVTEGFIPAAKGLGLRIVLLTDRPEAHRDCFARLDAGQCPDHLVACDVFNPLAVLDALTSGGEHPAAIFSNSDHLQTSTAIVAAYFGLPGKDWVTAYRAKNKAEMRAHLAALGIDAMWHAVVNDPAGLAAVLADAPMPCIVKPREGVASQQVSLCQHRADLESRCQAIWALRPGQPLLLEEYLEGPLYTLETLGDGRDLLVLGGFRVTLSPPPDFVEWQAMWGSGIPAMEERVTEVLRRFGIGFGACHTEYVVTSRGPRLIEINYRSVGDYREFLLRDALRIPLFEWVLRLYLGEPLPTMEAPSGAACIRYFPATAAGRITCSPDPGHWDDDGISVSYRALRAIGDTVVLTRSNKDYLGVLRGVGGDADRLQAAMERIGSTLAWDISA